MQVCIVLAVVLLCPKPPPAPATAKGAFCDLARPIYWDPADTRQTKQQADEHNAVGKSRCGWGRR
jgi:hypothetical protein